MAPCSAVWRQDKDQRCLFARLLDVVPGLLRVPCFPEFHQTCDLAQLSLRYHPCWRLFVGLLHASP